VNIAHIDPGTNVPDPLLNGTKPASSVTYLTDTLGDRAVGYIKQHASEPFFLYLAFNAAHTPMEASEKYLARFPNIADPQRRTYAAMMSAMDDAIGRTLAALRDQKLEEKTLVIFLNDNGGPTMPTTTVNGSSNAPLRGSKRQTWEGGIRVPFAMSWKGHLAAGRVDDRPIIQLDVLPTALCCRGRSDERIGVRRREPLAISDRYSERRAARRAVLAPRRHDGDSQRRLEAGEDARRPVSRRGPVDATRSLGRRSLQSRGRYRRDAESHRRTSGQGKGAQ